MKHDHERK